MRRNSFPDCFPFLLLSDKSVDELNRRLEESETGVQVSDTWFRPNISVKDVSGPFVEDEWTYVKIGEGAVFRVNKLCGRCEYTNVDPETGTKIPRGEVLKVSAQTGFVREVWFFCCNLIAFPQNHHMDYITISATVPY